MVWLTYIIPFVRQNSCLHGKLAWLMCLKERKNLWAEFQCCLIQFCLIRLLSALLCSRGVETSCRSFTPCILHNNGKSCSNMLLLYYAPLQWSSEPTICSPQAFQISQNNSEVNNFDFGSHPLNSSHSKLIDMCRLYFCILFCWMDVVCTTMVCLKIY